MPRSPAGERGPQVCLVTGATGAIGGAIARGLAARSECEVVLACRSEDKAGQAVRAIVQATGNRKVRYAAVDVSRKASVFGLAAGWRGPLHLLVNVAAVAPRRRQETPEGIELAFATNVLGYCWMIQAFADHLGRSAPSRVVNVASYWAGDLDLADLEFRRRRYSSREAYRQSKQADRMLTAAFAERLAPHGISVTACHPGDVNSTLSNHLGFGGHETPDDGARTPLWLALDPVGEERSGRYFERTREVRCPFAADRRSVDALYEACLRF